MANRRSLRYAARDPETGSTAIVVVTYEPGSGRAALKVLSRLLLRLVVTVKDSP